LDGVAFIKAVHKIKSLKNGIALLVIFMAQACSPGPKPEFEEVTKNYYSNQSSFEEVKNLACKITFTRGVKLRGATEDIENEELKQALLKIGVSEVSASSHEGKCKIALTYYAIALGGSGVSYNYIRNIQVGQLYNPKVHTLAAVEAPNSGKIKFYKELEDGWYFVFNKS
jgi:hypothetical protein